MTRSSRMPSGRAHDGGGHGGSDEIEFLSPRVDVFGGADGFIAIGLDDEAEALAFSDVDEPARTRATTALAGFALAGLIAVGVVAAAPWSADQPAATPTTTAAPPATTATTVTAPATTEPAMPAPAPSAPLGDAGEDLSPHGPGYLIIRPPAGLAAVGAYDQGPRGAPAAHLDIWATPGADRTAGTWIAVASTDSATFRADVMPDAAVVDIGGVAGLVAVDRDDVTVMTWRPALGARIATASRGIPLDRLLDIASSISVVDGVATYAIPPAADDGTELTRIVDEGRTSDDLGVQAVQLAERVVAYEDRSGTTALVVGTRRLDEVDPLIARFLLATATAPDGTPVARRVTSNGRELAVGSLPLQPRTSVVQWEQDGELITVVATVPVDRLVRSLRTGRMAEEAEWDDLIDRAYLDANAGDDRAAFTPIGSGRADGVLWTAALSEDAGYLVLRSAELAYSERVVPDPDVPIRIYRSTDVTFVVALLGEPSAGFLVVKRPGADPISVPLVAVDDGTWSGAVAAFDGAGAYDATIATVGG